MPVIIVSDNVVLVIFTSVFSGLSSAEHASLPPELVKNEEFAVLVARFKSLFSWPLIMGETPV